VSLLRTRELLLQEHGHDVVSASNYTIALDQCRSSKPFDLFILGHSIPHTDKVALISAFRADSAAPVIALKRDDERHVTNADFEIEPAPPEVLRVIEEIVGGRRQAAG